MAKDLSADRERQRGSIVYVVMVCAVAALGGLLFGYDTGVISGAIGPLVARFSLNSTMEGWAASCALVGCMVGAALAGTLSDRLGRKRVLILSAVCFFISAVGTAIPRNLVEFILFRFLGGLGVGAASMTSPMYIAEITPARIRGRMVSVNQFAIVSGFLVVYFANYIIGGVGIGIDLVTIKPIAYQSSVTKPDFPLPPDVIAEQIVIESERLYLLRWDEKESSANILLRNVVTNLTIETSDFIVDNKELSSLVKEQMLSLLESQPESLREPELFSTTLLERIQGQLSGQGQSGWMPSKQAILELAKVASEIETVVRTVISKLSEQGYTSWNVRAGWRWMFGSESLPAFLLLALVFFVPESPRWLTKQGRENEAMGILSRVDGSDFARKELAEIREAIAQESGSVLQLFQPGMRIVLAIGVILAILQQVTGINAVLYYAPEIFKNIGADTESALLQTVVVGVVNILFTVFAVWTVDKLGRKPLMLFGAAGMAVTLTFLGLAFYRQQTGVWVLLMVLGYIACFAMALGPVTWVILSEIFPTRIRGRAMAIATVVLWIACYAVSQTFPMLDKNPYLVTTFHHGFSFWVYAVFCVMEVLFVALWVPETRGKTLEQIEKLWPTAMEAGNQ
ncbi:MAG: sugar porter family MFS transporter [Sedimentisphaerales bacterium]|nr:sugar porter family MFS transporter [Sedimentisphaerales bacterium]